MVNGTDRKDELVLYQIGDHRHTLAQYHIEVDETSQNDSVWKRSGQLGAKPKQAKSTDRQRALAPSSTLLLLWKGTRIHDAVQLPLP